MAEERDPQVAAAYRALGAEEPPRALDEAILAAARHARPGDRRPGPSWTRRWAVPLSLAAVLVLSITVTLRIQHEAPVKSLNEVLEIRVAQRTKELEDANHALRIANRNLEQFAFSASHDLREPLRNVAIYSQILQKQYGGQFDEKADRYLGYLVHGAQRMDRLVSDLLTYTRAGIADEGLSSVDSGKVLNSVVSNLREALESTKGTVTSDALPTVLMYETALERLLANLIENAIKYRKEDEPPMVHVSARMSGDLWQFSIKDNGIGIAPEYHEQVFGVFKRLHGQGGKIDRKSVV